MSAATIASLNFAGRQVTIYFGALILIPGLIGGILVIIVFLSLKTFRENSCAFYLTIMSIVNIGQLLTGSLSRIVSNSFGVDWTLTSLFYCKFRLYCNQVCTLTSMSCICLATIDQYFATCSNPQWQQWCNIKLARRLSVIFTFIWIIHNIPYLIYYNHVVSSTTGNITCIITNYIFIQYTNYGIVVILDKLLPLCITFFFGFLAYRNVKQLPNRTVPLVRRKLDKQLTVMVLVQVISGAFTILPNAIIYPISVVPQLIQNPVINAQIQFVISLTISLIYVYYASPFYIFMFVSERFRRQLKYVLFDVYLKRWRRQRRMIVNQVMPQT